MNAAADLPESWKADESGTGRSRARLWIALAVLVVIGLAVGLAVVVIQRKDAADVEWPNSVGGRAPGLGEVNVPATKVDVTAEPGVYIWSDFDGWHVWVVNGGDVAGLKGSITGKKADIAKAAIAVKGAGSLERDGKVLTLELPAEPGLVGVDFQPGFHERALTFRFTSADGKALPKSLVHKGRTATPVTLPFTVDKVRREDAPKD